MCLFGDSAIKPIRCYQKLINVPILIFFCLSISDIRRKFTYAHEDRYLHLDMP